MSIAAEAPTIEPKKSYVTIASEMFGADFHGEIGEEEETAPLAASDSEIEEINEEVSEDVSEETIDEPEPDEVPISSLQELIEQNQYDPEWFNSLKVPVKINGETSNASFADLVSSYQMKEAAERRLVEAKETAKSITTEAAQKSEALREQFATTAKLVEKAQTILNKDQAKIDWDQLRRDDPAEWTAKKAEFAERQNELEVVKRETRAELERLQADQQREQESQIKQLIQVETDALLKAIPEWQNPQQGQTGKKQVAEYLLSQGFSKEEINNAVDHRLILISRKAMLFDSNQQGANAAAKKVAKIPKVLKPGSTKSPEQTNKQKLERLKAQMIRTGSVEDAHAYQQALRSMK